MKKWLNFGREILIIISLTVGASVIAFTLTTWSDSGETFDRTLWLQAIESKLKEQNEENFNTVYERYSRIHRDLNDYQYLTGKRLEALENRVERLERELNRSSNINISNGSNGGITNDP